MSALISSYKGTGHTLWPHFMRPYLQIRPHSDVLGVRILISGFFFMGREILIPIRDHIFYADDTCQTWFLFCFFCTCLCPSPSLKHASFTLSCFSTACQCHPYPHKPSVFISHACQMPTVVPICWPLNPSSLMFSTVLPSVLGLLHSTVLSLWTEVMAFIPFYIYLVSGMWLVKNTIFDWLNTDFYAPCEAFLKSQPKPLLSGRQNTVIPK